MKSDSIKLAISKFVCKTGILKLSAKRRSDRFLILTYHRVSDSKTPYFRDSMAMSSNAFEAQMAYLKESTNIRHLRYALAKITDKSSFEPSTVVITFDDGYVDNYTIAFPILKKYNIPATIFLTTGPLNTGKPLWWDRIAGIIAFIWKTEKNISTSPFHIFTQNTDLIRFTNSVIDSINLMDKSSRSAFMNRLDQWMQIQNIPEPESPMITWDMVRNMAAAGIAFETHTVSHRMLHELTPDALKEEVIPARNQIREITGQPADILASPRGKSLYPEQLKILKNAFQAICTGSQTGWNFHSSDPYNLQRKDAGYLLIAGQTYRDYLEAETCGFFDVFRKTYKLR